MIAPTLSSRMQLAGAVFAINGALISWLNGPEGFETEKASAEDFVVRADPTSVEVRNKG